MCDCDDNKGSEYSQYDTNKITFIREEIEIPNK